MLLPKIFLNANRQLARFSCLCLLLTACIQSTKTTKDKARESFKTLVSKTIVKTPPKAVAKDIIRTATAVEFMTAYGQKHQETYVQLHTRLGVMTLRLYKNTPLHRASFLYLTEKGYFDTTCFYRVVPGFIVQGGNSDSEQTTAFRNRLNNYLLPSEFRKNRKHKRGALAAARDWEHNPEKKSTPFEFYVIQSHKLQSHLDYEHTVFGEVVEGIELIDKIAAEAIDVYEWPKKDISIKMTVLK